VPVTRQYSNVLSFLLLIFRIFNKERWYREKLKHKAKKFAEYYAQSGNAPESAEQTGYSAKYINLNGQKLLQNTALTKITNALHRQERTSGTIRLIRLKKR
jgi:phage terminase small subunit